MLAARFPQYRVVNLAQNGYGNLQALVQLRALADKLGKDDRFIFVYGDYMRQRNVAAPSWLRMLNSVTSNFHADKRLFRHPYPKSSDRNLEIGYTEIFCAEGAEGCRRSAPEPSDAEMVSATLLIFDEIASIAGNARMVIAYIGGPDGDPVVGALGKKGLNVVDIRPVGSNNESDNSMPFDSHPGPLSQTYFFLKLSDGLRRHFGLKTGK
jgi:hypothetical protein